MKNYFITPIINGGNNQYYDAIDILEDSMSPEWFHSRMMFFNSSHGTIILPRNRELISSQVIFFHTGHCELIPSNSENEAAETIKSHSLMLGGLNITLHFLINSLGAGYDGEFDQEQKQNLISPDLTPYVIVFLIIDKNSIEMSETIKSVLDKNSESKKPVHLITIPVPEEDSDETSYKEIIPSMIRDFAEAVSSGDITEQSYIKVNNILKLFDGAKLYSTRQKFANHYEMSIERGYIEEAESNGQFLDEKVEIFQAGEITLAYAKNTYSTPGEICKVYFGTNRAPEYGDNDSIIGFTSDRFKKIICGTCTVQIPKTHRIGGNKPKWKRLLGIDKIRLIEIKEFQTNDFWNSIEDTLSTFDDKSATIFIHGYNVSFEEAAIQTAQLCSDLHIPGIFAFYSWPSQGTYKGYMADESTIIASFKYISDFIENFSKVVNVEKINIIAHSMGNRGVLDAFDRVLRKVFIQKGKKINQIILAAPDVDVDVFDLFHDAYTSTAARTTIYVSDKDKALQFSGALHQFSRIGLTPPISIYKDIDTVFVGDLDLSFIGHGYVASSRVVLTDMHQLLLNNIEPRKRMGLKILKAQNGTYYKLNK